MNEHLAGRTRFNTDKAIRYGEFVAGVLLHAASKEVDVRNIKQQLRKDTSYDPDLERELRRQEDKRLYRTREATLLARTGLYITLQRLGDEESRMSGTLTGVDTRKATLQLQPNRSAELNEILYAAPAPVPDDVDQAYFGHELLVDMRVHSAPSDKLWVLND